MFPIFSSQSSLISRHVPLLAPSQTPSPVRIITKRYRQLLAPKRFRGDQKSLKGRNPMPITSRKGSHLEFGDYGIRFTQAVTIEAKVIASASEALRKNLKGTRGVQTWMRCFPDVPICVKGSETRMGKGKGAFDHWATRCHPGKIIYEIRGPALRPEIAHKALTAVLSVLPGKPEIITKTTPAKLGTVSENKLKVGLGKEVEAKRLAAGDVIPQPLMARGIVTTSREERAGPYTGRGKREEKKVKDLTEEIEKMNFGNGEKEISKSDSFAPFPNTSAAQRLAA